MNIKKFLRNYINKRWKLYALLVVVFAAAFGFYLIPSREVAERSALANSGTGTTIASAPPVKPQHVITPDKVRAIYMTSWVAGTKNWREELVNFIEKTELNSIVIDVKDYSGRISFDTGDSVIKAEGSEEIRVKDMKSFIDELHGKGVYVIARITVFQDPFYSKKHPTAAVQTKSGTLWRDKKGISYLDPGSKEAWDYTIRIARDSEAVGFDELNFDYIRFPSDGNMSSIAFPASMKILKSGEASSATSTPWKVRVLSSFFSYLHQNLKDVGVPISADVFGMTTTNRDDLNIGQVLEAIIPYFDYVAPMVYPSHYPPTFHGFKNPADHPYEVIYFAMSSAVTRLNAASTSPDKLRPWIQDFNLGAKYDATKIIAEKKAIYDSGLDSWMSWDAGNKYTRGAYGEASISAAIHNSL